MKKKKGFTMVELLGAVVILGILMLVAIPAVNSYIQKSRTKYYDAQKRNLIVATKSYIKNNNMAPKEVGDFSDISMDELVDNKYISVIKDAYKKECTGNKNNLFDDSQEYTFVRIKKEEDRLVYTAHLWCPNYKDVDLTENSADITISAALTIESGKKIVTINMVSNNNTNIKDFTYNIYKGDVNLVERKGVVNGLTYSDRHDITRFITEYNTKLKCYVRVVDEDGGVYVKFFDLDEIPKPNNAECFDKKQEFDEDTNTFRYSFLCTSPNGCESSVYRGSVSVTSNSVTTLKVPIRDREDPGLSSTCDFTVPARVNPVTATPTPTAIPTFTKGCPKAVPANKDWTKGKIIVKYTLSNATDGYRVVGNNSNGGWSKYDKQAKKTIKFTKDTTFTNVSLGSSDRVKERTYTNTGTFYFLINVRERTSANASATTTLCMTDDAYGPYKLDNTAPKYVSGSVSRVKNNVKRVTIKYKVTDAHSGIQYVYISESKTASASTIRKKGKKYSNKGTVSISNTSSYSSGTHTFYVHVLDRVGNKLDAKIGKVKLPSVSANCNHRSPSTYKVGYWCGTCCGKHGSHNRAYYHLCVSSNGKVSIASSWKYICPTSPEPKYKPVPGWKK
ncbi:MAG: prepilin-type N-terminal cleavage/methylation domain-containing protein [Bacilli bacterium]|nr:prepilin-type N-terminal cleavage/methylation domain-containing protein [Bacilli bacterium]